MAEYLGQGGGAEQVGGPGPGMTAAPGGGYQASGGGGGLASFGGGTPGAGGKKDSQDQNGKDLDMLILGLLAGIPGAQLLSMIGKPAKDDK